MQTVPRSGESTLYYRLRPEVLGEFNGRTRAWPKRDHFRAFFRDIKGYRGELERNWRPLTEGKPVPHAIANAFAEYLQERMGREHATLGTLFLPAPPPPEEGVWESSHTVLHALTEQFGDCDEMYLHNPVKDCLAAARMILDSYGWMLAEPGDALDVPSCLRRAEDKIGRSAEALAAWLRELSRDDEFFRLIAFVASGGARIGATVVLPLNQSAFERLCDGELDQFTITPADLASPAYGLYLFGMSDCERFPGLSARERTLAQVRTLFYQMAYFTRRMRPLRPAWACSITNAHYGDRLRRYGFRPNGKLMCGTDLPITCLRHPRVAGENTVQAWVPYKLMTMMLSLYRTVNRDEWKEEDRVRRKRGR